jgi:hypothetical protein
MGSRSGKVKLARMWIVFGGTLTPVIAERRLRRIRDLA